MAKDMLLVIDMQNVYIDGKWKCVRMQEVIENINTLKRSFNVDDVYYTLFIAPENPRGTWKAYNEENKDVNEDEYANLLSGLLDTENISKENIITKSTYSSYKSDKIKSIIESGRYDRVVVCGVTAGCCVIATVFDLIDTGIPVLYISDAVGQHTEGTGVYTEKILGSLDVHVTLTNTIQYIENK